MNHIVLSKSALANLPARTATRPERQKPRASGASVHSGGGMWTHFPYQGYRFVEVRDLPS